MKKQTRLAAMLVTAIMLLAFGTTAAMAAGNDVMIISADDVIYGDKGDLSALKMEGSSDSKEIWIEGGALTQAQKKSLKFGIDMGAAKISFAPDAFFNDAWKSANKSGDPVEIKLLIDASAKVDLADNFNSVAQKGKGNYALDGYGVSVEAYIFVGGKNTYTMKKFVTPVQITYDYKEAWGTGIDNISQKNITLAWYDLDKKISNNRQWIRLNSKVDLENQKVTGTAIYACGVYMPIGCKGLDNTGGGSGGSVIVDGGGSNSNKPAGGIPNGHWATADILQMQQAGIVPADLSNIQIDKPISRGEFVSYIVKSLKLPEDTSLAGKFTDVKTSNPYYAAILTGAFYNILNGVSANSFQPNANLSRQEMAVLFNRALANRKIEVSTDNAKLGKMSDCNSVATWALDGCAVAVNKGLIGGQENNKFAPKANTTWAESIVMLNRLCKMLDV